MTKITFSQLVAGALFALCLATAPAKAIVDHTYVSGRGADAGGCSSPASACRTFAYAIAQTSASGEIIVLDPADYSPVTITKSISIVADGAGPAGIIVATGNAITISAGTSGVVNLRGLTLDGEGTAVNGILLNTAGSLTISDCFVRHFGNVGILLTPTVLGVRNVSILNSVMNDNNGSGLTASGANFLVTVRKSVANNNGTGFSVTGGAILTLADTMAIGNSTGVLIVPAGNDASRSSVYSYGDNEIGWDVANVSGGTLNTLTKQ